jgi:deoxyribonuclease-4
MFKYGLKLWSTNQEYIPDLIKLYKQRKFNYIELYCVPGSFNEYINKWEEVKIPYIIHAPHSKHGFNLAKKENEIKNRKLFNEAKNFANRLKAKYIIIHPGLAGDIKEVNRQITLIYDKRILVENMPLLAIDNKTICQGATIKELLNIFKKHKLGFCLDISHAICTANFLKVKPIPFLKKMVKISPKLYHFSDGQYDGIIDQHLNIGKGNYPIKKIMSLLSRSCLISIETTKNYPNNLKDFKLDIQILNQINKDDTLR